MAEFGFYALASLLGAGALFNVNKQQRALKNGLNQDDVSTKPNPKPNGSNIYHSRDFFKVQGEEVRRADACWRDAQDPIMTNVIPMYYNTLHIKGDAEKIPNASYQNRLIYNVIEKLDPTAKAQVKKSIKVIHDRERDATPDWGIVMDRPRVEEQSRDPLAQIGGALVPGNEDFSHNNMVPFYKSTITQDIRYDSRGKEGKLELYTGQYKLNADQKQEVGRFFEPVKGLTNIYGSSEVRDMSRYVPSNLGKKHNEAPIERVRVGPGLNQGYTAQPSGGMHQTLRIRPKPIEELRVDPVLETEGRIKPGKAPTERRTMVAQMYRNRPELLVENKKGERNFTTVGSVSGRTLRPNVIVRDTHRKKSRFLITHGKYSEGGAQAAIPKSKISRNQNFFNTPFRNAHRVKHEQGDAGKGGDYGRSSYKSYINNRVLTGLTNFILNPRGVADKLKTRMQDKVRKTRKQHYIRSARIYGQLGGTGAARPSAQPAYDPVAWAARTTIRETTEDSKHVGIVGTTQRRQVAYDPKVRARTTIRETTEDSKHVGIVGTAQRKQIAYDPKVRARTTIRETTEDSKHVGIVGTAQRKQIAYDPKVRARTTIRETTENGTRVGNTASVKTGGGGYATTNWEAKSTQKQFLSDNEYTGIGNASDKKMVSTEAAYNARVNVMKERVAKGRRPGGGGPRFGHQEIKVEAKKLEEDRMNQRAHMKDSGVGNIFNPNATTFCTNTSERNHLPQLDTRLDVGLLDAFKRNPLTQSLSSYY
jgi:hypothetical protein